MSLLANIAAGAIGGTGESLVSIGKTQAQAEIEEAKALRAQAFAEKMYEKQREDTVSDMDTKRGWALDDQSTVLAMEMGDRAVADERYRIETNFKLEQAEENKRRWEEEIALKKEDAEKQQLILQNKVNSENRKAYSDTLGVINDLDGRIATIQKEMIGVPEDQAASMTIELNGLKARREEHIEQAKAWLPANLRESFNRHEDTKKYGSASVMSKLPIETVKKISERDYSEGKIKELADAVAKGDTEAEQILVVLTLHNPGVAAQVNALLPEKETDVPKTGLLSDESVDPWNKEDRSKVTGRTVLPQTPFKGMLETSLVEGKIQEEKANKIYSSMKNVSKEEKIKRINILRGEKRFSDDILILVEEMINQE